MFIYKFSFVSDFDSEIYEEAFFSTKEKAVAYLIKRVKEDIIEDSGNINPPVISNEDIKDRFYIGLSKSIRYLSTIASYEYVVTTIKLDEE